MRGFCIDFRDEGKNTPLADLTVDEYDEADLDAELVENSATTPAELTSAYHYHRVVFADEAAGEAMLAEYRTTYERLITGDFCVNRHLRALSYFRPFLVMALMGFKMRTIREYHRPFKPGQLINLHDRTYFVTVEILSVTDIGDGFYRYDFKLPDEVMTRLGVGLVP